MVDIARPAVRVRPFAEVAAAVSFLTRIPIASDVESGRTGAAAFGIVGAGLGAISAVPVFVAGASHPLLAALVAIGLVAILDGGLHLDGLADTADALAAPAGAAERARTDPRTGSAGVVAVVLVLGLQAAAIAELSSGGAPLAAAVVVVALAVSRATAPAWAITVGRSVGPRDGLGRWFAEQTGYGAAAFALTTALVVAIGAFLLVGPAILVAAAGGTVIAVIAGLLVMGARGQLDGDGYGAMVEITATAILVVAVLVR